MCLLRIYILCLKESIGRQKTIVRFDLLAPYSRPYLLLCSDAFALRFVITSCVRVLLVVSSFSSSLRLHEQVD